MAKYILPQLVNYVMECDGSMDSTTHFQYFFSIIYGGTKVWGNNATNINKSWLPGNTGSFAYTKWLHRSTLTIIVFSLLFFASM